MKKILIASAFTLLTTVIFAQNPNANQAQRKARQDSLTKEAAKTELWEPVPKLVTPGATPSSAPSDAIILFDGTSVNEWDKKGGGAPGWKIDEEKALTVVKGSGDIATKKKFNNFQLHIEWRSPAVVAGASQTRGNSGIFLMGSYELQVLDSYDNPTYVNGQAGSIYKQQIPLVNASKKPGEWQTYDVVFTAPVFGADDKVVSPARVTVLHNGILVLNNAEIKGNTEWIGLPKYVKLEPKEPLILQDHGRDGGNPVSYRNIWIREL